MELREILGTLSSIAVLVGVGIAILQLRALRTQRQVEAVETLARALHERLDALGEPHVEVD